MVKLRPCRAIGTLVLSLSAACGSEDPTGPVDPIFYRTTVAANPVNSLSAIATIDAARYDSAVVRFWRAGETPEQTPAFRFGADSTLRVPVLGLHASSSYLLETLVYVDDAPTRADTAEFISGPMPAWIPAISTIGTDTTPGLLTASLPDGPIIVDNQGRVRWYVHLPGNTLTSLQTHANGRYSLFGLTDPDRFDILNELGETVGSASCQGFPTRFHDFLMLPGGDYWILCDDTRVLDLTAHGGVANASVSGTVIQHISADGQLLFQWNAFDHFAITDLPALDRSGPNVNFTHGNAIAIDTDGNIIASFRSLSEITKIDATTGDVIWRFGGLANQFTFVNDPKGTFERQHGVRLAGPGQLQFLDNGLSAPSRLVRYLLNPVTKAALLVMSFEDAPSTFTQVGGSTDYFPDGHANVSYGRAGRVIEVDPAGNRAWELAGLDGTYVFRAERITNLYRPIPLSRSREP